jgi:anthranilate synthase component 1
MEENMKEKTLTTYYKKIVGDTDTPITLYHKYVGDKTGFLLESKEQPKGRYSMMGTNPLYTLKAYGQEIEVTNSVKSRHYTGRALDIVHELLGSFNVSDPNNLPFIGGAVGTVGYDTIKQYEEIESHTVDTIGTPDVHLMFVDETVVYDHYKSDIYIIVLEPPTPEGKARAENRIAEIETMITASSHILADTDTEPLTFTNNMTKEDYMNIVKRAKEYIYEGDIFQVVLSQRFSGECTIPPFNLYRRLRRLNPSPYMYYFKMDDYYIVGSSPEMLVEINSNTIYNCPIAGTRKRGSNPHEDAELAADLLADKKEIAEHIMLVDLGRNDMGKVSEIGSVKVSRYMEVQNYSHVMHITSLVEGQKRKDATDYDVLMSFLPAGTLSGAPKIRAMEIIEELEPHKRGIYGGAIGYFGYTGNMDTAIVIRTMVIKDDMVHIQAGAGIVADSDPETEYEETKSKAQALISALNNAN